MISCFRFNVSSITICDKLKPPLKVHKMTLHKLNHCAKFAKARINFQFVILMNISEISNICLFSKKIINPDSFTIFTY